MVSAADFSRLKLFVEENTGVSIPESNYQQVRDYITDKIGGKVPDIGSYLIKILRDTEEYNRLMEAVTINETYFFREEKQFKFLRDTILPRLNREQTKIFIWSSSCSSGEEALSLYSLCLKITGGSDKARVFASDINNQMLESFRQGIYRPNCFREDGSEFTPLIKSIAVEQFDGKWKIDPVHLNKISIYHNNLFIPQAENLPEMDIIFLRNTLIYMNMENKRIIIDNVINKLKIGGLLFLSAAELPLISHPALSIENSGNGYFFRKRNPRTLSPAVLAENINRAARRKNNTNRRRNISIVKESAIEKNYITENEICTIISMRLNNEVYIKGDERAEKTADLIIRFFEYIGLDEYESGEKMLADISDKPEYRNAPGLVNYLLGGIRYQSGLNSEAEKFYRKALQYNDSLWPARFFLIKTLPPEHHELKDQIISLKKKIIEYIEGHRWDYQFMLEGFNARYFLLICEKMFAETERRYS